MNHPPYTLFLDDDQSQRYRARLACKSRIARGIAAVIKIPTCF
jgi:hypothetical protein